MSYRQSRSKILDGHERSFSIVAPCCKPWISNYSAHLCVLNSMTPSNSKGALEIHLCFFCFGNTLDFLEKQWFILWNFKRNKWHFIPWIFSMNTLRFKVPWKKALEFEINSKNIRNHFGLLDFPSFVRLWADFFFLCVKRLHFKKTCVGCFWSKIIKFGTHVVPLWLMVQPSRWGLEGWNYHRSVESNFILTLSSWQEVMLHEHTINLSNLRPATSQS